MLLMYLHSQTERQAAEHAVKSNLRELKFLSHILEVLLQRVDPVFILCQVILVSL